MLSPLLHAQRLSLSLTQRSQYFEFLAYNGFRQLKVSPFGDTYLSRIEIALMERNEETVQEDKSHTRTQTAFGTV